MIRKPFFFINPLLSCSYFKVFLNFKANHQEEKQMNRKGIIGAIIGDIAGSRFEWNNCKSTQFEFFTPACRFTDDSVMTIAVADWLTNHNDLSETMHKWGNHYPHAGYGGMFRRWLSSMSPETRKPYNSFGNGSGMRVSPCGFYARPIEEALDLARQSAEVTHNHPEGIKGAQAIASAIFLAQKGESKQTIKDYIEKTFGYDLHRTLDEIRPDYDFDVTCQGSCPEAILAFLESNAYESAIRLAISLGGDSDTIACMSGGIAAAVYGVPDELIGQAEAFLDSNMIGAIHAFEMAISDR